MGSLASGLKIKVYPEVKAILADESNEVSKEGNFAKVKSNEIEYYFLADSAVEIDTKPEAFRVVNSTKHDCLFIVPVASEGFKRF